MREGVRDIDGGRGLWILMGEGVGDIDEEGRIFMRDIHGESGWGILMGDGGAGYSWESEIFTVNSESLPRDVHVQLLDLTISSCTRRNLFRNLLFNQTKVVINYNFTIDFAQSEKCN